MNRHEHWQAVYSNKPTDEVSWYREHLQRSLDFIGACGLGVDARIVDVGGGASTLTEDLLAAGHRNLVVMDIAPAALDAARDRLGALAESVEWIVGDVTTALLDDASVDFWHDRAVFHFLTEPADRAAYASQVRRCVKPGGYALIATFGLDGPERCSGLPIVRYDAGGILAALGEGFDKASEANEIHVTPQGKSQSFVYCLCRRRR